MIFQLLLACCLFYLCHSSYVAEVSNNVLPMKYECNATNNLALKAAMFHVAIPHKMVEPGLRIMFNNMNKANITETDFSQVVIRYFEYCNEMDCWVSSTIRNLGVNSYITPPEMKEELDSYIYSYTSAYISTYHLSSSLLNYSPPGPNLYRVHVLLADKSPFLRTTNYCTGIMFFKCASARSKFYYEYELQREFHSNFKYNAFIVIASDRAYYAWLNMMRRMQFRAGAVLRLNSMSDNPLDHLVNVSKELSCLSYDESTRWANSVLYDMSIRVSFPSPILPLVHKGTILPYFIFTVPWQMNSDLKAKADGFFIKQYLSDLVGLIMSRYPHVKVDFISLDPDNVNNRRIEVYDTMNPHIIPRNAVNHVSSYYRATTRLNGRAITELDKHIPYITQQIFRTVNRYPQTIFVPIVTSFVCQNPALSTTNYVEKLLRQLENFQGHSILISSSTKETERFIPVEEMKLYYSKIRSYAFDIHVATEVFRIAEIHLQNVSKELQRTNTLITDMTQTVNTVLPISHLTNKNIEMLVAIPSTVYKPSFQVAINNFLTNNFVITRYYLQQIFRPIVMLTGLAKYPIAEESSNLDNCEIVQDLTYTAFEKQVFTKISQHPHKINGYKTIEFNNCIQKISWNPGAYKVAVIFVNEYNSPWMEYLTKRVGDFTRKGLKKTGIIIVVSDQMTAPEHVLQEKDVYLIQSSHCANLKKCIANVIWNSQLGESTKERK